MQVDARVPWCIVWLPVAPPCSVCDPGRPKFVVVLTLYGPVVATALPGHGLVLGAQPFPARQAVTLSFFLPAAGSVRLEAFDVRGRRVRGLIDELRQPGTGTVVWDGLDDAGSPVGSGLYFVRVTAGGASRVTRAAFTH